MKGENYNFAEVVASAKKKCENRFILGAKEALLEDTDWVWEDELQLLNEEVRAVADQCRADETKKMVNAIERNFKRQISDPVEMQLSTATPDMWDKVLGVFRDTLTKAETTYLSKAKSFNCTDDENTLALAILRRRAWRALRAKIDEQTADAAILTRLRSHFEERFRYDERDVPRVWKPEDDIDGAFQKARDLTLTLIPLYSKIRPEDPASSYTLPTDAVPLSDDPEADENFDFESSLVIFPETKVLDLSTRFRKDADAYYVEAKRSTVPSIAQIPPWMYGVLLVLGWNELMAVLFNPLYFTMLLMFGGFAWIVFQLGLAGPLLQILQTLVGEVQRQATDRLRDHFSQPALTEPVRTQPLTRAMEEIEMDKDAQRRTTEPL